MQLLLLVSISNRTMFCQW